MLQFCATSQVQKYFRQHCCFGSGSVFHLVWVRNILFFTLNGHLKKALLLFFIFFLGMGDLKCKTSGLDLTINKGKTSVRKETESPETLKTSAIVTKQKAVSKEPKRPATPDSKDESKVIRLHLIFPLLLLLHWFSCLMGQFSSGSDNSEIPGCCPVIVRKILVIALRLSKSWLTAGAQFVAIVGGRIALLSLVYKWFSSHIQC